MLCERDKNVPWRHHFIPEFYLKRWTANGQLVEFSQPYGKIVKPKRVYPSVTGFVPGLYHLEGLPPEAHQQLEPAFFRPVVTQAATILRAMEAGQKGFNTRERSAWARFLMSLLLRTPEALEAAKARLAEDILTTDAASERRYRRHRRPGDPPTFREYIAEADSKDAISREAVETMVLTADSRKVGEHLIHMQWGSLRLPVFVPALMTSDRPLLVDNALEHPQCTLLLPIGPKRIFYAVNDRALAAQLRLMRPHALVRRINEGVVKRAAKYVYAMGDDQLAYVQKNMGTAQEPTLPERVVAVRENRAGVKARRR